MWLQSKLVRLCTCLLSKDRHVRQIWQVELLVQQPPLDEMIAYIPQIYMDLHTSHIHVAQKLLGTRASEPMAHRDNTVSRKGSHGDPA